MCGRFGCGFRRHSMFFIGVPWLIPFRLHNWRGSSPYKQLSASQHEISNNNEPITDYLMCFVQFRIKFRYVGGFLGPGTNLRKACTYRGESIYRNVYVRTPCRLNPTIPLLEHSKAAVVGQPLLGLQASSDTDTRRLTKSNLQSLPL